MCARSLVNCFDYILKQLREGGHAQPAPLLQQMDCVKRRFEAAVESFCCSGWEELLEPLAPLDAGSLQ